MKILLNFIFKAKTYTLCVCLLLLAIACKENTKKAEDYKSTPLFLLKEEYKNNLTKAYLFLDSINTTDNITKKQAFYKQARHFFKLSEPILSYSDKENYKALNSPNLLRIQEEDLTDVKINNPIGFQVIEENLFSEEIDTAALKSIVDITSGRLKFIERNTSLQLKNYHILWLVRDHIIRVATTGLSNFDSPMLGQSLQESANTYQTIAQILSFYKDNFSNAELWDAWQNEITKTKQDLQADFDTFDRFAFIQNHTNKQIELWNATVKNWEVTFPFAMALSNDFDLLFSEDMFNLAFFADYKSDTVHLKQKIELGKQLFNDKNLALNRQMSCATCHDKNLAFTDGKKTFDDRQKRNTPTLTYAGLQKAFFYDNRAGSLEGQIVGVVTNHTEFDADLEILVDRVSENKQYVQAFDTLYTKKITDANIRHAIASYVRSLNKFNSKFDKNINNQANNLTPQEKNGFNLFMGKAACATCHFPPLFNGTVPPNFTESEMEILGVPKAADNKKLDDDLGRYDLFKTEERKFMFKTPTVRNIALTAPYMHNGVYNTLEEVVDFYNQGGGTGLGFDVAHQTLPFDELNLTEQEIKDIIAFMQTLTDKN